MVFGNGDLFFLPVLPLVFKYFWGPPLDGFLVPFLLLLPDIGEHALNVSGMLFAPISDAVFGYCDVDLQSFIIVWCKVDAQSGELIFEHVNSFDLELHSVSLLLPKGIPGVIQIE